MCPHIPIDLSIFVVVLPSYKVYGMSKGRVCFNMLITLEYFETVISIYSICYVHFICFVII